MRFADGSARHAYKLTGSRVSSSGVVIAHYERSGEIKIGDTAMEKPSKAEDARQPDLRRPLAHKLAALDETLAAARAAGARFAPLAEARETL